MPAFKAKQIILCAFLDVSCGSPCSYFLFFSLNIWETVELFVFLDTHVPSGNQAVSQVLPQKGVHGQIVGGVGSNGISGPLIFGSAAFPSHLGTPPDPLSDAMPIKHTGHPLVMGLRYCGKPDLIRLIKPAIFIWEEELKQEL